MSDEFDNIMKNIKLSEGVINDITNREVKRIINKFTERSKIGERVIHYEFLGIDSSIYDKVISNTREILESKGFYTTKCSSYSIAISVDKLSRWKKFLCRIRWF